MASYHRVLQLFGRSVDDKMLECNYDLNAWDVSINGERWSGKVRLIGYIDIFFLVSYTGDSRFEDGIVIYKEDDIIREILSAAEVDPEAIGLSPVSSKGTEKKYFGFANGDLEYVVTSLGHKIGLKKTYDPANLSCYAVKITKNPDITWKRRVRRGIAQHTTFQLGQDLVRLGFISQADLITELCSRFLVGGVADDAVRKYVGGLGGGRSSSG